MDRLRAWARGHRTGAAVVAAALALFCALSVARCVAVHSAPEETAAEAAQEADDAEALPEGYGSATSDASPDAQEVEKDLEGTTWTANGGKTTLRFDGDTVEVEGDGTSRKTHYAVLSARTVTREVDGVKCSVEQFCLLDSKGCHEAEVVEPSKGTATLTTDAFSPSSWALAERGGDIKVTGPGGDWCEAHKTSVDAVEKALRSYVAERYPTATSATWTETSVTDEKRHATAISFDLGGVTGATATVTIDAKGSVSAGDGGLS